MTGWPKSITIEAPDGKPSHIMTPFPSTTNSIIEKTGRLEKKSCCGADHDERRISDRHRIFRGQSPARFTGCPKATRDPRAENQVMAILSPSRASRSRLPQEDQADPGGRTPRAPRPWHETGSQEEKVHRQRQWPLADMGICRPRRVQPMVLGSSDRLLMLAIGATSAAISSRSCMARFMSAWLPIAGLRTSIRGYMGSTTGRQSELDQSRGCVLPKTYGNCQAEKGMKLTSADRE